MLGDHIRALKSGKWVHAIDLGDQRVLHLQEQPGLAPGDRLVRVYKPDFTAGAERVELVVHRERTYQPRAVVARAWSRFMDPSVLAAFTDSEQFAAWCKIGRMPEHAAEEAAPAAEPAPAAKPARAAPAAKKAAAVAKPVAAKKVAATKPAPTKAPTKKPAKAAPKVAKPAAKARPAAKKPVEKVAKAPAKKRVAPAKKAAARATPKKKAGAKKGAARKKR
ncbi:MAG TPA: hypothetical protein VFP50_05620 [Anaeromyxobacteraceae bacterium]|nr:hypothetical protein [Anaeromyxobacteraceae bacterium]